MKNFKRYPVGFEIKNQNSLKGKGRRKYEKNKFSSNGRN